MRKITREAVWAFRNCEPRKLGNTWVGYKGGLWSMVLHGNRIAWYESGERHITTAGWRTHTTCERLNGLDGVSVYIKGGKLYLNGKEWDGKSIAV